VLVELIRSAYVKELYLILDDSRFEINPSFDSPHNLTDWIILCPIIHVLGLYKESEPTLGSHPERSFFIVIATSKYHLFTTL